MTSKADSILTILHDATKLADGATGKVHNLKCWPEFYDEVESGGKPFEIRKNDRDFQVGDTLRIKQYDPLCQSFSGRYCVKLVTYMTDWEQREGYVVLGLQSTLLPRMAEAMEVLVNGLECHCAAWRNHDRKCAGCELKARAHSILTGGEGKV